MCKFIYLIKPLSHTYQHIYIIYYIGIIIIAQRLNVCKQKVITELYSVN